MLNDSSRIVEANGPTMGTSWSVKYVASEQSEVEVLEAITEALAAVNQSMSTYIADSELMTLNKADIGETFEASPELFRLVEQAQNLSEMSHGAYDVTVGALVNLWGFGSGKSYAGQLPDSISEDSAPAFTEWMNKGRADRVPDEKAIAQALAETGYQTLILDSKNRTITKTKPVFIDLSSIAKGYGVDAAAQAMEQLGITSYMMEIGGEIRLRGVKPDGDTWKVAVREPVLENRIHTIVSLDNRAIATSGDYLNYYEVDGVHFSHLINARTGYPEQHRLASVAVIDDDTGLADAYATMFMILGEEKGIAVAELHGIDAYFIYYTDDGFASRSTGNFDAYRIEK